jgi:hypothetical protein
MTTHSLQANRIITIARLAKNVRTNRALNELWLGAYSIETPHPGLGITATLRMVRN